MTVERDDADNLVAHPDRFPSGIPALAERVKDMGFLFGIYESAGEITCQGLPGSLSTSDPISPT
jgi:alpha-galactosidase